MSLDSTQLSLLSTLESTATTTDTEVFSRFSAYLSPFSKLKLQPPNSAKTLTVTRSLAKQFLPFLNRALSTLPKILHSSSPAAHSTSSADLFRTYVLCLDCLELVSSQLSCKPYSIETHRLRMVRCMESCGRYSDAVTEGIRVLERLLVMKEAVDGGDRGEFSGVVVEVGVVVVKCVGSLRDKVMGGAVYRKVLWVVEKTREWFG